MASLDWRRLLESEGLPQVSLGREPYRSRVYEPPVYQPPVYRPPVYQPQPPPYYRQEEPVYRPQEPVYRPQEPVYRPQPQQRPPVQQQPAPSQPAPRPAEQRQPEQRPPAPRAGPSRPLVRTPPKHILFASNISGSVGKYTLSKAEIDQAIQKHGTNIAVMVDVGGRIKPTSSAHDMLTYIKNKGVQHIGIYTEGRTGVTGGSYDPAEFARRKEISKQYGLSDSQWMGGGWQRHFYDQVRHYSKNYGATFFEADNIPGGQTIGFLKNFHDARMKGQLPRDAQFLLKNPKDNELSQLKTALGNGSIHRSSVADFSISEEDDRRNWKSLEQSLAGVGIQLGTSDNTHKYAVKQSFGQNLLSAFTRWMGGKPEQQPDWAKKAFKDTPEPYATPQRVVEAQQRGAERQAERERQKAEQQKAEQQKAASPPQQVAAVEHRPAQQNNGQQPPQQRDEYPRYPEPRYQEPRYQERPTPDFSQGYGGQDNDPRYNDQRVSARPERF
jgi:hypothetical protein